MFVDLITTNNEKKYWANNIQDVIDSLEIDNGIYGSYLNYKPFYVQSLSFGLIGGDKRKEDKCIISLWDGEHNSQTQQIFKYWIIDSENKLTVPNLIDPFNIVPHRKDECFFNLSKDGYLALTLRREFELSKYQYPVRYNSGEVIDLNNIISKIESRIK